MESSEDITMLVDGLLRFRDTLQEMSLLLKDYQAMRDEQFQGPARACAQQFVQKLRQSDRDGS